MSSSLFRRTGAGDFSKFLKVMVSGPPKSGKTTLLGTVPNLLVLDTEPHANNLESIAHLDVPYATITNTNDLREAAMVLGNDGLRQQLAQGTYGIPDIGAVAIDTLDTLQKIMKSERMKEQRSTSFQRDDWGWLKNEMEKIIEMFTALPMHVFFMVHLKTKDIGKGDDVNTVVLPGLEGGIAESIAGMVGYSLLSFRKEEIKPDGSVQTKYWLRTEGDAAHDFLGTRTAGRLPTIIEPNMKTIYDAVMANRPKAAPPVAPPAQPQAAAPTVSAPPPAPSPAETSTGPTEAPATPPTEEVAQNEGQAEQVQTPVETPAPPAAPEPTAPQQPPAEKASDDEPISPAAMGHVKRVYEAIEVPFPQAVVETITMGEARTIVKYWRAIQGDHSEGKGTPGTSPQSEMLEILTAHGWMPPEGSEPEPAKEEVEAKVDGTIAQVEKYISGPDGVELERVQEAYDLEMEKGENARKSLISKLEGFGAKPSKPTPAPTPDTSTPDSEPASEVQTPVETPSPQAETPVTPSPEPTDTPPTEDEATKAVEEGLGGTVIEEGVNPDGKCEVCNNKIDDVDLAELGVRRFGKLLCVTDYLAEIKK